MNYIINICVNKKMKCFDTANLLFDGEYFYIPKEYFCLKNNLILPLVKQDNEWFIKSFNLKNKVDVSMSTLNSLESTINDMYDDRLTIIVSQNDAVVEEQQITKTEVFSVYVQDAKMQYSITFVKKGDISLDGKFYGLKKEVISIGRSEECDIVYKLSESISRKHFVIYADEKGEFYAESLKDKANFYLNNELVMKQKLNYGDVISLLDLKIVFFKSCLVIYGTVSKISENLEFIIVDRNQMLAESSIAPHRKKIEFYRNPKILTKYRKEDIKVELPPPNPENKKMPLILSIGPSLTMSMTMLVTLSVSISNAMSGGNYTTIIVSGALTFSMLLGAILWPILTRKFQGKQEREAKNKRYTKYSKYLDQQRSILEKKNKENVRILNDELYPNLNTIAKYLKNEKIFTFYLYNSTIDDEDFMKVRLGTSNVKSDINIVMGEETFSLDDDDLRESAFELKRDLSYIPNCPTTISLIDERVIGVVGRNDQTNILLKNIVASLTYSHAYNEVKLGFIYPSGIENSMSWVARLPHVYDDSMNYRYIAKNALEIHQLFMKLDEFIELQLQDTENKNKDKKRFVFFVFGRELVEDEMCIKKISNIDRDLGISFIYISDELYKLPTDCRFMIKFDQDKVNYYCKNKDKNIVEELVIDEFNEENFNTYINELDRYQLKVSSNASDIPERISFLGMYKVGNIGQLNIQSRWEQNAAYRSLAAPIGAKSGGTILSLDMNEDYHGPHGLAAGMTGSGKSEFLQTLILSLALNYNPEDISFILIDFKGGGMANLFDELPHLAGKMTNLSGNELTRAMISIDAEIKRRQRLFKEVSTKENTVNHIDKYQKLYKSGANISPLSHLIIIADEFAQLKSQQPEFMKKLIDIAQIGRSLGIHMLLATQKPAGVVDEQIWGNSRYRVCLKVLDKQDSQEMIKRPDAAMIKIPGRGYMQVGYDEVFESFQCGYCGCAYEELEIYQDDNQSKVSLINTLGSEILSKTTKKKIASKNSTQLTALVTYMHDLAEELKIKAEKIWIEPLPRLISLDIVLDKRFDGDWQDTQTYGVPVGILDDPAHQLQIPYVIDILDGNIGVFGNPGSGKTTFLQTYIYSMCIKYPPSKVAFHIFDFGGRTLSAFKNAPHVRELLFSDSSDISSSFHQIVELIEERKKVFGEIGASSIDAYNKNAKEKLPVEIVVIDNYSIINERYQGLNDDVLKIVREGNSYGVFAIITGTLKNTVYYRVTDYLVNSVAFRLPDKITYRDIMRLSVNVEPLETKGRCLVEYGGDILEMQVAIVDGQADDISRAEGVKSIFSQMANVESAPKTVKLEKKAIKLDSKENLILGKIEKDDFGFEYKKFKTLVVFGNEHEKNLEVLRFIVEKIEFDVYSFDLFDELKIKGKHFTKEEISQGIAEINKKADKPRCVVIPNLQSFYEYTSQEEANILENIAQELNDRNIFFIVEDETSRIQNMTMTAFYCYLKKDESYKGLYFGEELLEQHIFSIKNRNFDRKAINDNTLFAISDERQYLIDWRNSNE